MGLPDEAVKTLPDAQGHARASRNRTLRRIGILIILALVVAAATGTLERERTTVSRSGESELSIQHPAVLRPGISITFSIAATTAG